MRRSSRVTERFNPLPTAVMRPRATPRRCGRRLTCVRNSLLLDGSSMRPVHTETSRGSQCAGIDPEDRAHSAPVYLVAGEPAIAMRVRSDHLRAGVLERRPAIAVVRIRY